VDGIGKRLVVNEVPVFTSELHPRNMIQSGIATQSQSNTKSLQDLKTIGLEEISRLVWHFL
jgi:hypothetical protein